MFIVADIGGTKMRVAASTDLEKFDEPLIVDTPPDYESGLAVLLQAIRERSAGEGITGVCMGVPGSIAKDRRSTLNRKNLAGWSTKPIVDDIERAVSAPVTLENDAALVGLGEAVFGAGVGAPIVAYLTVSTGVNGVRIVDGKIDRSAMGFEIGGQYIPSSAEFTFENLVSGKAIQEKYGKPPRELGTDTPVWEDLAHITAFAVNNTLLHWSPDRVVFGGSMFNEIGIKVDRVREHVAAIMKEFPELPKFMHSSLGDVGGLYGGLARLKQLG